MRSDVVANRPLPTALATALQLGRFFPGIADFFAPPFVQPAGGAGKPFVPTASGGYAKRRGHTQAAAISARCASGVDRTSRALWHFPTVSA
jgi:hypothetical protein